MNRSATPSPRPVGRPVKDALAAGSGMLSERAKASFDAIVQAALVRNLSPAGERAQLQPIAELPKKSKDKKAVVLTIASDQFRLVLALHVRLDAEGKRFFARLRNMNVDEWPEQEFLDAVNELGNICCGAMNRDLGKHFAHVGMSTPNLLDREALGFVEALGKGYRKLYQLQGIETDLFATLFVAPFAALDFHAEIEVDADEAEAGELEMF